MFPTATIVFREILEVALVLTIVMAATKGLPGRVPLVLAGLGLGVAGAIVIAFFTDAISDMIDGVGQEVFNACIMFVAVGFLSWTIIWMKRHGRELANNLKVMGADVTAGRKSMYVLVGVIALATFREGAEIVLFTYSMVSAEVYTLSEIVMGGAIGTVGGIIVGAMLYLGLLTTVKRHLFTVTSWMLIVLTAGMAAQGAGFLIQADILPPLYPEMWDTSAILSGQSFIGQTLSVLIGYTPRPTGMELVFYCTVLFTIGAAYKFIGSAPMKPAPMVPAE